MFKRKLEKKYKVAETLKTFEFDGRKFLEILKFDFGEMFCCEHTWETKT
mgnify:FL=1